MNKQICIIKLCKPLLLVSVIITACLMISCGSNKNIVSDSTDIKLFEKISAYKSTNLEDNDNIDKLVRLLPGSEHVKGWERVSYKDESCLLLRYVIEDDDWNPSKNDFMKNAAYMFMAIGDIGGLRVELSEDGEEEQSFLFVRAEYEDLLGKITEYDDFNEWKEKVMGYAENYNMKTAEEFLRRLITVGNYDLYVASVPEIEIDDSQLSVIGEERISQETAEFAHDYQIWLRLCNSFAEYFSKSGMETFIKNHSTRIYTRYIDEVNGKVEGALNFTNHILTKDIVMTVSQETEYDDSIMNVYDYTGTYVQPDGSKEGFEGRYHMTTFKGKWPKIGIRKYATDLVDKFK